MLPSGRNLEGEAYARNRFVRKICEAGRAYALGGPDGLVRVRSRFSKGQDVTLLWSQASMAQRHAARMPARPRLKELSVAEIIQDVIPGVDRFKRLIGPDWGIEAVDAEVEPRELSERLRVESVNSFAGRVMRKGLVWILEDEEGPALLISALNPEMQVLPCWSEQADAERRLVGPFASMVVSSTPIASFIERTLPWLSERNRLVAPEHFWGGGAIELDPAELRFRLAALDAA